MRICLKLFVLMFEGLFDFLVCSVVLCIILLLICWYSELCIFFIGLKSIELSFVFCVLGCFLWSCFMILLVSGSILW